MKKITMAVALAIAAAAGALVVAGTAEAHSLHGNCEGAFSNPGDSVFHSTTPPGITINPGPGNLVSWTTIGATSISGTFETGEHGSASKPNTPCGDDTTTTAKATTTTAAPTTTEQATTTTEAATTTTAAATTTTVEDTTTTAPAPTTTEVGATTTTVAAAPPAAEQTPPAPPAAAPTPAVAPTPVGVTPASAEAGLPHTGRREDIIIGIGFDLLVVGAVLLVLSRRRRIA